MRRLVRASALFCAFALLSGCAAGIAFRKGEDRAKVGDWDTAVAYYRQAVQGDPNKPEFRIALERAMLNASHGHYDVARQLEAKDQLDAALLEYRKTVEFDPANRQAVEKVAQLERTIRDRIEAARPRPAIVELREQARQASAEPLLNPRSRDPIRFQFTQANIRDILNAIANAAGINITYDPTFQDRAISINLNGVPLEQALNTVLMSNGLFYSVIDSSTIVVAPDTAPNRLRYERQVAITIPLSYGDSTELAQMLTQITRTTAAGMAPIIVPNKTNNTLTIRATQAVIDVIRELVASNDKPRAEVTLDVEILEVNHGRVKDLGVNLTQYQLGLVFSPDQAPPGAAGAASGATANPIFNLNTISKGVSTADFYLAVPAAIVHFLESDTQTKVLVQTQLRGAEGAQLTLNIGAREPYLTTTFSPIATGGANVNPLSSYTFEQVGVSVVATPRVTDEGDILIALQLKNSALGPTRTVGGGPAPSFTNREVTTTLRLRDGESHLLAGLLQDQQQKILTGFPGITSVPFLRNLLSENQNNDAQTDIVMLVTPRVIRTHEYTAKDLSPIYVGTNQNFGLNGPPPLIAAPPEAVPSPVAPAPVVPPQGIPVPSVPQGGTPGQVTTPTLPLAPPQPQPAAPGAQPQASGAAAAPQADVVGPLGDPQINLRAPQSPTTTTLAATAQVSVTPPAGDVRVASGPYMVPVYINGAARISTITVTVNYNPAALRVRSIQEGNFLRQGNVAVSFSPNTDATIGRVDLTFVRTGDAVGASGAGLLAGILFDAVGSGTSQLTVSGVATNPTGTAVPLQFTPATVVVR
jgi:general secretion pathway protein D